ncbi:MAG: NUDIX domain-containing protein [Bacilli bacterium]|nr:NUDIX domain-containing protein [Bacilli bacterium]
MKIITIKEPWASLIINGYKKFEFRNWKTKYRGNILIQASKNPDLKNINKFNDYKLKYASGEIIGQAQLTDCILVDNKLKKQLCEQNNLVYENVEENKYALSLDNVVKFENKIPCKGQLGIWNYNEELRNLYDENKQKTNKIIKKDDMIPENYYVIVVAIFIQNKNKEFLIQKRSIDKGNKWSVTSGHPKLNETSIQGLCSELKEELNLTINIDDVKLFKTVKTNNTFFDMYYLKMNIDEKKLTIQKSEVQEIKWATYEEIKQIIENNEYHNKNIEIFQNCFDYLNNTSL